MKIEKVSIDSIKVYPNNAKIHTAEQIEEELENEVNTSSESSFNYKEQYGVIVICKNEEDQEKVYNKLLDQGYECKVVTT